MSRGLREGLTAVREAYSTTFGSTRNGPQLTHYQTLLLTHAGKDSASPNKQPASIVKALMKAWASSRLQLRAIRSSVVQSADSTEHTFHVYRVCYLCSGCVDTQHLPTAGYVRYLQRTADRHLLVLLQPCDERTSCMV